MRTEGKAFERETARFRHATPELTNFDSDVSATSVD